MPERIPIREALKAATANAEGMMRGRGAENRLEPECWPAIRPSFRFAKDQSFFAIGSCFAENISKRLALDGYNVIGATSDDAGRRIRYTPPAIFQEIEWAHRIFHRDDAVCADDVDALTIEHGPDNFSDLWSRSDQGLVSSREEVLDQRRSLYRYFRGALTADVVVITLGLIEAWWDEVSHSYVQFDPRFARRTDRDRFSFERLDFGQSKDFVGRAIDLIDDGGRHVLLTTSPVVLGRTFTVDDVLVANCLSKSTLRAVAGELATERDRVDYFPSYEIATMTRAPYVWEDDLIHVQPSFIARIMDHVGKAYLNDESQASDDRALALELCNMEDAGRTDEAVKRLDDLGDRIWNQSDPAVHMAAARVLWNEGDRASALRHARAIDSGTDLIATNHPEWLFELARIFEESGEHAEADRLYAAFTTLVLSQPYTFHTTFVRFRTRRDAKALDWMANLALQHKPKQAQAIQAIASHLRQGGRSDDADALIAAQLVHTPDDVTLNKLKARAQVATGDHAGAAATAAHLCSLDQDDGWALDILAKSLQRCGKIEAALSAADRLVTLKPDDGRALALRARLRWKTGDREGAAADAKKVSDRVPSDAVAAGQVARILREALNR